jgi:hypothetical protein
MVRRFSSFVHRALTGLVVVLPALSAQGSCANANFAAETLISNWNERAAKTNLGAAWTLPKYNGLGSIRKTLEGSSLLLVARVDKNACVYRIDIKSRRADSSGYAALVAWSSVIIVTNPSLSCQRRRGRQSSRPCGSTNQTPGALAPLTV